MYIITTHVSQRRKERVNPGVNFINILRTNFWYERCFSTYM